MANAPPDARCLACNFDNSNLPEGNPCPECAMEYLWAVGGPAFSEADVRWSRAIRRAHTLLTMCFIAWTIACAAYAMLYLMYDFVINAYAWAPRVEDLHAAKSVAVSAAWATVILFTTAQWILYQKERDHPRPQWPRDVARVLISLFFSTLRVRRTLGRLA